MHFTLTITPITEVLLIPILHIQNQEPSEENYPSAYTDILISVRGPFFWDLKSIMKYVLTEERRKINHLIMKAWILLLT
jgi:hypothetical protein